MNLKKIDKKLYKMIFIFAIAFIAFIILIVVGKLILGGRTSYKNIETKMKDAAISYYSVRKDNLPKNNEKTTVSVETLVEAKNIKPLAKLTKDKNTTCKGHVTVQNNNGYYSYIPYLDCGEDYKTTTLSNKLKDGNIVTSGNGLYQVGEDYVYRGEFVNNYVSFAGQTWRIMRINSDNTIRMIQIIPYKYYDNVVWDNRYNAEVKKSAGINNYQISRIRDTINGIYNNEKFFTSVEKSQIVSHDVCIGKRSLYEENNSGSIECSEKLEKQPISLLQVNEFYQASIDPGCKGFVTPSCINYNYLVNIGRSFWTVTADKDSTTDVFEVNGYPYFSKASERTAILAVIHLSGDTIYTSGDGTEENPYIIK